MNCITYIPCGTILIPTRSFCISAGDSFTIDLPMSNGEIEITGTCSKRLKAKGNRVIFPPGEMSSPGMYQMRYVVDGKGVELGSIESHVGVLTPKIDNISAISSIVMQMETLKGVSQRIEKLEKQVNGFHAFL